MRYQTYYMPNARSQLNQLEPSLSKRIIKKIKFFRNSQNPLHYAKQLKDRSIAQYRFRIGDYRVLFDVDKQGKITILVILSVKHRKEVYKALK